MECRSVQVYMKFPAVGKLSRFLLFVGSLGCIMGKVSGADTEDAVLQTTKNCLLKFTEGNSQIWRKCSGRTVSDGTGTEYSLSEAGAAPEPVLGGCANGEKHMMRMHDLSRVSFVPVLYGISEYESGRRSEKYRKRHMDRNSVCTEIRYRIYSLEGGKSNAENHIWRSGKRSLPSSDIF